MKKLFAMLLAMAMMVSLFACSSGNPDPTQAASEPPASQNTEESAEPTTAPTEEPGPAAENPDDIPDTMTSSDSKYQVAFITDVGQLKDKSFNQGTFDGVKLYAAANGKSYKYY